MSSRAEARSACSSRSRSSTSTTREAMKKSEYKSRTPLSGAAGNEPLARVRRDYCLLCNCPFYLPSPTAPSPFYWLHGRALRLSNWLESMSADGPTQTSNCKVNPGNMRVCFYVAEHYLCCIIRFRVEMYSFFLSRSRIVKREFLKIQAKLRFFFSSAQFKKSVILQNKGQHFSPNIYHIFMDPLCDKFKKTEVFKGINLKLLLLFF